jgi:hypothetical protein
MKWRKTGDVLEVAEDECVTNGDPISINYTHARQFKFRNEVHELEPFRNTTSIRVFHCLNHVTPLVGHFPPLRSSLGFGLRLGLKI